MIKFCVVCVNNLGLIFFFLLFNSNVKELFEVIFLYVIVFLSVVL